MTGRRRLPRSNLTFVEISTSLKKAAVGRSDLPTAADAR
jgi:hypothetical protein